jgi:3-oxoacyl-[acyl-carrier protein] reductase
VTGGSRGIGAAIARAFAARGDLVAVHYRDATAAAAAVRNALPGDGHVAVRADLMDADAVRAMVDEAAGRLGGLDVLVNNAGIYLEHPVTGTSYQEWQDAWRATLGVNLVGAANVTWCAVRHMVARGGGRIVNVGSRGAFRGEPAHPAYGASKAGLHAFGQSLAVALAPHGIAVASVAPGYVETDMTVEELATPAGDRIRAQSPFNRVALTEEVAAAVVYLASPEALWASGAVLDLNGASYLRLAGTVFGIDPPGDRAVPDVGAAPEAEALPGAEERGRLVVGHRDRHLGAVAGVQRPLVIPAELGREAPGVAGVAQALSADHQGVGVVGVLPRFRCLRPARRCRHAGRVRPRRRGVERDEGSVSNLPHRDHLSSGGRMLARCMFLCWSRYSWRPPPEAAGR